MRCRLTPLTFSSRRNRWSRRGRCPGRLVDGLGVDDRGGRLGLASFRDADLRPHDVNDVRPCAVLGPAGEHVVHGAARRVVGGRVRPLDAVVVHVEHGIDHRPPPVLLRPAAERGVAQHHRQRGLQDGPFPVGHVRGVTRRALPAAARAPAFTVPGRGSGLLGVRFHGGSSVSESLSSPPFTGDPSPWSRFTS